MKRTCLALVSILGSLIDPVQHSSADTDVPYICEQNIVYAEVHGIGLLADVFTPQAEKNGAAIVEVASGAWHSDRSKLDDLAEAQVFDILCQHGYTVFAIRPGSISKFSALEMVANVERGIRWAKSQAETYGIDADRFGLMGASAGGHLACLAAVTYGKSSGEPDAAVAAAGVFFPATDLIDYGAIKIDPSSNSQLGKLIRRLAFPEGVDGLDEAQIQQRLTAISPARLVTANTPPFLLIHGSADFMVPLQQSQVLLAALEEHDVPAELIVKQGGGHPWPTVHEEVEIMADWFDQQLGVAPSRAAE
jgi:acetyl esterase/lipase